MLRPLTDLRRMARLGGEKRHALTAPRPAFGVAQVSRRGAQARLLCPAAAASIGVGHDDAATASRAKRSRDRTRGRRVKPTHGSSAGESRSVPARGEDQGTLDFGRHTSRRIKAGLRVGVSANRRAYPPRSESRCFRATFVTVGVPTVPRASPMAISGSLMTTGPTPAFVLAHVSGADGVRGRLCPPAEAWRFAAGAATAAHLEALRKQGSAASRPATGRSCRAAESSCPERRRFATRSQLRVGTPR
jgi:hypothetical protein